MASDSTYQPNVYRAQGGSSLVIKNGGSIDLDDSGLINFGNAADVALKWDGTNLTIIPVTDDTGALHVGNGTKDFDLKWFGGTTAKYALFDMGAALLTLEDVDLHLGDNDKIELGDAAGGDVQMLWNATNLVITPATDDTGAIYFGDGTKDIDVRIHQGTTTDYVEFDVGAKALEVAGDTRIDLSAATVAAANTDGGVIKAGTSGAPVTEDTANMKFVSMYFDDGATSGEAVGIYDRLYVTGAGGEGIALRAFGSVTDVAAANARGGHVSLSYGASGSVTGLGAALETTLHMPSGGGMAGTNTSLKVAINSDGANADPAGATEISFVRLEAQGTQGGIDDLEDDGYFFSIQGFATNDADAAHMVSSVSLAELPTGTMGIRCKLGASIYYIPLVAQAQWN